ncbi:MAG: HAMP domain-containing sensor histidine kinase [Candidatus Omnitrophota bacterium]|nr:HAMP domain-containing sensor histidine kinase [Candidatus Omnitrophota bacterium]
MLNENFSEGLMERLDWLIRLRWIAVIGVCFTIFFVAQVLKINLAIFPLYSVALFLLLYNFAIHKYLNYIKKKNLASLATITNRLANLQISLDLLSLASLIHFSGGIENPFIFYFIFHMIIASILLSRRASFLQASFATGLFILVVSLEYFNFLDHYRLKGFVVYDLHQNLIYILGVSFVFISTLYLAVYMATSISVRLRQKEKSLREANLLLEEKDRIKSEYVLRVSHDIKEHLSTIETCLEPVAQGLTGELNPRQNDLIQRAKERTEKLLFFVKALLEITRIKLSRQIEMVDFSLRKTIENAINFVETKANDKGISLSCNIASTIDTIKGAQIYIEETIANLLANSVKYTPKNGEVSIDLKDKGHSVLIKISDTGIGIPENEIGRIFEEFYRAKNARQTEREGTGLGLSIAKQVVERHKGKIWVESEGEGKGSKFFIILPKGLPKL